MTHCEIVRWSLSQSVSKNLTAYWLKRTYFSLESWDVKFPNDVYRGVVRLVEMGQNNDFREKIPENSVLDGYKSGSRCISSMPEPSVSSSSSLLTFIIIYPCSNPFSLFKEKLQRFLRWVLCTARNTFGFVQFKYTSFHSFFAQ